MSQLSIYTVIATNAIKASSFKVIWGIVGNDKVPNIRIKRTAIGVGKITTVDRVTRNKQPKIR